MAERNAQGNLLGKTLSYNLWLLTTPILVELALYNTEYYVIAHNLVAGMYIFS